jgi:hypothetical protein
MPPHRIDPVFCSMAHNRDLNADPTLRPRRLPGYLILFAAILLLHLMLLSLLLFKTGTSSAKNRHDIDLEQFAHRLKSPPAPSGHHWHGPSRAE